MPDTITRPEPPVTDLAAGYDAGLEESWAAWLAWRAARPAQARAALEAAAAL